MLVVVLVLAFFQSLPLPFLPLPAWRAWWRFVVLPWCDGVRCLGLTISPSFGRRGMGWLGGRQHGFRKNGSPMSWPDYIALLWQAWHGLAWRFASMASVGLGLEDAVNKHAEGQRTPVAPPADQRLLVVSRLRIALVMRSAEITCEIMADVAAFQNPGPTCGFRPINHRHQIKEPGSGATTSSPASRRIFCTPDDAAASTWPSPRRRMCGVT